MKTYVIYHIPGVKIGCTTQYPYRCQEQGYEVYEILETHDDGWIAGDRELELQKEYGYPVDTSHYMISVQNRIPSTEACSRGGITQGNINKMNGQWERIQKIGRRLGAAATNSIRKKCTICGYESTPAGISHHNKKCK